MKEKQFDHIISKIKEAAENVAPEFDDQNWERMAVLLDEDKKRRRPFWLWLPVLSIVVALMFFIGKELMPNHFHSTDAKNTTKPILKNDFTNNTAARYTKSILSTNRSGEKVVALKEKVAAEKEESSAKPHRKIFQSKSKTALSFLKTVPGEEVFKQMESEVDSNITASSTRYSRLQLLQLLPDTPSLQLRSKHANDNPITSKINEPSKRNTLLTKFYITAVGGFENNTVKALNAGGGTLVFRNAFSLGYQFNKRFAFQIGFASSRKKYIADAKYYNIKSGSYWSMVELKSVDANCLVYEIPFSIKYSFKPVGKINIFATSGLSSFIMKREDYVYYYNRNGQPYQRPMTYTGNSRFLSNLTLSAGAEYPLTKKLSALAEPFISVPLAGVGDGEVKIHSVGANIGLKFSLKK